MAFSDSGAYTRPKPPLEGAGENAWGAHAVAWFWSPRLRDRRARTRSARRRVFDTTEHQPRCGPVKLAHFDGRRRRLTRITTGDRSRGTWPRPPRAVPVFKCRVCRPSGNIERGAIARAKAPGSEHRMGAPSLLSKGGGGTFYPMIVMIFRTSTHYRTKVRPPTFPLGKDGAPAP